MEEISLDNSEQLTMQNKVSTNRSKNNTSQTSKVCDDACLDCLVEKRNKNTVNKNQIEISSIINDISLNCEEEKNNKKNSNSNEDMPDADNAQNFGIKNLSFWIGIVVFVVVALQFVLELIGIEFETKIIIEISSYVLAALVSTGLLSSKLKSENKLKLKDEIMKQINNGVTNKSKRQEKSKSKSFD